MLVNQTSNIAFPRKQLNEIVIRVTHFSKCYDDAVAVRDLSFHVEPGQVLGLVGRNGAGKTTTLRSITGIIPATDGQLVVDGCDLESAPIEVKQRTAYVPDDPQLFEDLTVLQHLQFQASVYGVAKPDSHIDLLLDEFELAFKRDARASSLSRGMRQKLAICCAYVQRPKALLLDEPMTGLDPQAIRQLKRSVSRQSDSGTAVIISSHLLAMVEDICSHVLVLDRGQRKFFGSIDGLRQSFADRGAATSSTLEEAFFSALSTMEAEVERELGHSPAAAEPNPSQTSTEPIR